MTYPGMEIIRLLWGFDREHLVPRIMNTFDNTILAEIITRAFRTAEESIGERSSPSVGLVHTACIW